jgi:hypothetical protein
MGPVLPRTSIYFMIITQKHKYENPMPGGITEYPVAGGNKYRNLAL